MWVVYDWRWIQQKSEQDKIVKDLQIKDQQTYIFDDYENINNKRKQQVFKQKSKQYIVYKCLT